MPIATNETIQRLSRDLREAAETMSDQEARFLVDAYYIIQEDRKRSNNQLLAMKGEPTLLLDWFAENNRVLENQIKGALDRYSSHNPRGEWLRSVPGIGPVIAAGLLAHIDITQCPTVGHLWSFAGLDPQREWKKGEKRPFNADLKTLCWKIGQSFMKLSKNDKDYYGHLYAERKVVEWRRNLAGELTDQARNMLNTKNFKKTTDAYQWYSGRFKDMVWVENKDGGKTAKGILPKAKEPGIEMLPPAHIDARARRWAVKLFLSHFHHEVFVLEYGKEPPEPYALAITGHAHLIPVPRFD